MGDSSEPLLLAPLSIGEIFDRAVAICVRNTAAFGAVSVESVNA